MTREEQIERMRLEILNDVKEFCTLPVYLNSTEYSCVDTTDED